MSRGAGRSAEVARLLLGLASVAVAFAAADTYVVVLALPDMMTSVGVRVVASSSAPPRSSPASCSGTSRCCR